MIVDYSEKYYPELLVLMKDMHSESRFRNYSFSEEQIKKYLSSKYVFCSLAIKDEKIVGFFVGSIQKMPFSDDYAGYDLALYIDKANRGGMFAIRLIKSFEDFCKKNNCVTINLNAGAEIANESARRLYKKLGYIEYGFMTHKEI